MRVLYLACTAQLRLNKDCMFLQQETENEPSSEMCALVPGSTCPHPSHGVHAVHLLVNLSAVITWSLAMPKVARVCSEFKVFLLSERLSKLMKSKCKKFVIKQSFFSVRSIA